MSGQARKKYRIEVYGIQAGESSFLDCLHAETGTAVEALESISGELPAGIQAGFYRPRFVVEELS